jgi:hypothetical protein
VQLEIVSDSKLRLEKVSSSKEKVGYDINLPTTTTSLPTASAIRQQQEKQEVPLER